METVFTRIINRETPAKIFHDDDEVIVIADYRPQAPVHLLIIPKQVTKNFYESPAELLSMLNEKVKMIAERLNLEDRFRVVINNGYRQEVDHLHYHFMSDRGAERLAWID